MTFSSTMPTAGTRRSSEASFIRRHLPYVLIAPSVILLVCLIAYPLVFALRNSFYFWNLQMGPQPLGFVGLDNYRTMIDDPAFRHAIGISLLFTAGSLVFQFTLGFALALFFNQPFPGNGTIRALFLLADRDGENLTGRDVVGLYGFRARSVVTPALERLRGKGLVARRGTRWRVVDPFFSGWLRRHSPLALRLALHRRSCAIHRTLSSPGE